MSKYLIWYQELMKQDVNLGMRLADVDVVKLDCL